MLALAGGLLAAEGGVEPAHGQGLFDAIFGGSKPPPPRAYAPRPSRPAASSGLLAAPPLHGRPREPVGTGAGGGFDRFLGPYDPRRRASFGSASSPLPSPAPRETRRYRALCVRLCDGYYWPMSFSAQRSEFAGLEETCRSRCHNDVRLYFLAPTSDHIAGALDRSGRPYGELATAFKYRKSLVRDCTCKPEPWSRAEQSRHAGYASEEAYERAEAERVRIAARVADAETVVAEGDGEAPLEVAEADPTDEIAAPTRPTVAAANSEAWSEATAALDGELDGARPAPSAIGSAPGAVMPGRLTAFVGKPVSTPAAHTEITVATASEPPPSSPSVAAATASRDRRLAASRSGRTVKGAARKRADAARERAKAPRQATVPKGISLRARAKAPIRVTGGPPVWPGDRPTAVR